MSIAGNVVDIRAETSSPGVIYIQPGDYVDVPERALEVREGRFTITAGSLDKEQTSSLDSANRTVFNTVPLKVEVFRAGVTDPVASAETMSGPSLAPDLDHPGRSYLTKLEVDAGPANESAHYSRTNYVIRLTNSSDRIAQVTWSISYVRDSSLVTEDAIPLTVLNNTFAIVLHALAPTARVEDKKLTIGISPEIAEFFDEVPTDGQITKDLSDDLPLGMRGELVDLGVAVVPGADALADIDARWAAVDQRIRRSAAGSGGTTIGGFLIANQIAANDAWRTAWHEKINPEDVAVRFNVALTDIDVILGRLWTEEISAGEIEDAAAKIYMVFKNHTAFEPDRFGMGHAVVFNSAHYEGALLETAEFLGLAPDIGEKIERYVNDAIPKIHRYFAEAMLRLVHDPYVKRFIDQRIVDGRLLIRFCDDPRDPGAFPRFPPAPEPGSGARTGTGSGASGGGAGGTVHIRGWRRRVFDDGRVDDGGAAPEIDPGEGSEEPEPVGVVPEGFSLGSAEGLARLDEVETIVVVMMENRSFDHFLGRLSRRWPHKGYRCYPDDATNVVPGRSPIKMIPARNIDVGPSYYAIPVDPYHGTKHVLAQVNGGKMDGFSADILTKPDEVDRNPQVPLTYYDEQDIPFFYQLAEQFLVCDRWFAAHPGGTYPNRWAFLSGTMPRLTNFPPDDPMMGFIKTPTIFDYLNNAGVGWLYFESNIGMLRMYDRYRLDDQRVIQYSDGMKGFAVQAWAATLPPVVFIEPKITGIPPLAQASDDHPPANILRGQELLAEIVYILSKSPQWPKTMLVVTYDEHGGFYDHMPPPGTPDGDPAWTGGFKKIHPEGETYLGVRVPTFIVSPLVEPGSVSHEIFDHTSVIKTILTRHRAKFRRNIFNLFGERVPQINHLGEALKRREPRGGLSTAPERLRMPMAWKRVARTRSNFGDTRKPRVVLSNLPTEARSGEDEVPYGFSLARALMPKRPAAE